MRADRWPRDKSSEDAGSCESTGLRVKRRYKSAKCHGGVAGMLMTSNHKEAEEAIIEGTKWSFEFSGNEVTSIKTA